MGEKVHFILQKQKAKVSTGHLWSALSSLLPFGLSVVGSEYDAMNTVTSKEKDVHSWLSQRQLQRIPKWFSLLLICTASDALILSIWAKQLPQERMTKIQLCTSFLFKSCICLSLRKIDSKVSVKIYVGGLGSAAKLLNVNDLHTCIATKWVKCSQFVITHENWGEAIQIL